MTRKSITTVAGLAGVLMVAGPAMADEFSFNLGIGVGHHGTSVDLGIATGRPRPVVVQPAAVMHPVQAVPVYREVVERVWVPTIETRYHDVPVLDAWGQVIAYRREAYTVQSGYWNEVRRMVPVEPACGPTVLNGGPAVLSAGPGMLSGGPAMLSGGCVKRPYPTMTTGPRPTAIGAIQAGAINAMRAAQFGGFRTGYVR